MKYHINPETGNPGLCKAEKQCRFGSAEAHYSSPEEARAAYEQAQSTGSREPNGHEALPNPTDRNERYNLMKNNVPDGYTFFENGSRGVGATPDYFGFTKGMSSVSPHNGGLWYAQRNVMQQASYSAYFKSFEDADEWISEKDAAKAEAVGKEKGISRETATPSLKANKPFSAPAVSKPKAHQHQWSTLESRYNFEVLQCDGCGATRKVYDE